jgi:bifunctional DNA-binding transcriptional regulator/antitoxin component of YhaV-PrlF toxin-antitoxin module
MKYLKEVRINNSSNYINIPKSVCNFLQIKTGDIVEIDIIKIHKPKSYKKK